MLLSVSTNQPASPVFVNAIIWMTTKYQIWKLKQNARKFVIIITKSDRYFNLNLISTEPNAQFQSGLFQSILIRV